MKAFITITDDDIRAAICKYIEEEFGINPNKKDVIIQVRSSQNYKNKEWENGELQVQIKMEKK